MSGLHLVEKTKSRLRLAIPYSVFQQRSGMLQRSLLCGVAAICLLQFTGSRITLRCQRNLAQLTTCELTTRRLFTQATEDIIDLQGATIGSHDDTTRLELLTAGGMIPFDEVYTNFNGEKKSQDAAAIDVFVKSPQQKILKIQDDSRWISWIVGGLVLSVAIMCLILPIQVECYFDKTTELFSLKRVNVIWTGIQNYSLYEIRSIKILEKTDCDNNQKTYFTQLMLRSGQKINLDLPDSSIYPEEISQALHAFLAVPVEFEKVKI